MSVRYYTCKLSTWNSSITTSNNNSNNSCKKNRKSRLPALKPRPSRTKSQPKLNSGWELICSKVATLTKWTLTSELQVHCWDTQLFQPPSPKTRAFPECYFVLFWSRFKTVVNSWENGNNVCATTGEKREFIVSQEEFSSGKRHFWWDLLGWQ